MNTSLGERRALAAGIIRSRLGELGFWALLAVALLIFGLWNLDGRALWWDEGWTLSVARNWLELGHYGRLRDGALVRGGLEAAYPVTLPVALTMGLLGVGGWQGRVFGLVCAVAAVLLLAALANRLYGRRVAWATVAVSLLMLPDRQLHPILLGREVLAEMPMLMFLLGGYLCLWCALAGRRLFLVPASLLLGLAWMAKSQTMPFLVLSLAVPLLVALWARRWSTAATFGVALGAAWLVLLVFRWVGMALLIDPALPADSLSGLVGTVAVVLTPARRLYALVTLAVFGLPVVVGLLAALRALWRKRPRGAGEMTVTSWYVGLALATFCGSWLVWYLLLSVGWPRYAMPALFVGSIFVAALLRDLSGDFAFPRTPPGAGGRVRPDLRVVAALFLLVLYIGATGLALLPAYSHTERSAQRTAAFLNALPAGARIETYESELLFLLDQPYHYPPDQTHVQLIQRRMLGSPAPAGYDPLAADPDYLAVGAFEREYPLYANVIAAGHFRLIHEDGLYRVYQRIRPPAPPSAPAAP
jgi:4-amino-4-deoxy-L-arabinose transferase-like glycosyltransferase